MAAAIRERTATMTLSERKTIHEFAKIVKTNEHIKRLQGKTLEEERNITS